MAKCKYCQAELPEGTTICPDCGKDNKEEKKMTPGKTEFYSNLRVKPLVT